MPERYERGKELGKGAFATVYLGHDNKENKKVAIKKILLKKKKDVSASFMLF